MPDNHAPVIRFLGGSDVLYLEEGGKAYHPGDLIPRLSQARRLQLQASGLRFETVHHEPPVTPGGEPSEIAAADQIPDGAVVAAVEHSPAASTPSTHESKPRRAVKE